MRTARSEHRRAARVLVVGRWTPRHARELSARVRRRGNSRLLRAFGLRRLAALWRTGVSGRRVRLGEDAQAAFRGGRAAGGRRQVGAPANALRINQEGTSSIMNAATKRSIL